MGADYVHEALLKLAHWVRHLLFLPPITDAAAQTIRDLAYLVPRKLRSPEPRQYSAVKAKSLMPRLHVSGASGRTHRTPSSVDLGPNSIRIEHLARSSFTYTINPFSVLT